MQRSLEDLRVPVLEQEQAAYCGRASCECLAAHTSCTAQPVNPPRQGPIVSATPTARDQPFHPSLSRLAVSRPPRVVNLPIIETELMVRDTMEDLRVDHDYEQTLCGRAIDSRPQYVIVDLRTTSRT
jgi:hypothetical protein